MKKKKIEQLEPKKPKKRGEYITTVQELDGILILNVYRNRILWGRHCINTETGEYAQWHTVDKTWTGEKFGNLLDCDMRWYGYYYHEDGKKKLVFDTERERKIVEEKLGKKVKWKENAFELINRAEQEYRSKMRDKTENNRRNRVQDTMAMVPELPEGIRQWIFEKEGEKDFAFYEKDREKYYCSSCGKRSGEKYLHRTDGEKKIRHNDMVICPRCKKVIQVKKRTNKQEIITHFLLLQQINENISVARHFDVDIYWKAGEEREVLINESVRIVLYKLKHLPKYSAEIYYNQYSTGGVYAPQQKGGWDYEYGYFDNKSNPAQRRTHAGYLYEQGIEEALCDTAYQAWGRLFAQLAAANKKLDYNRLMCTQNDTAFIEMVERLFKGRFYKLLRETAENVSLWSCSYAGALRKSGQTIEDVFDIGDRQMINRIRDLDGGEKALAWMRWSDRTGKKIPQEVLEWLEENNIESADIEFISDKMSLQQIMNYTKRQQVESYKGKSIKTVLSQWEDYLRMCGKLKRHVEDEMIYKPRELKRRHDEAVFEIAQRDAELEAEEYNRKFPGVEDVLKEIKEKYEYTGENYFIVVPERCIDIVAEGRVLHHCAGSSDRYFDRIKQRETYICFLRKKEEPAKPYYTIEVEPGGTIRQHRGYLDEEPEIEEIRPFLREWQKAIKKRLNKKDREYAAVSAIKRVENIEELKEKNNTRVLNGLMEDFMEAV